MKLPPMKDLTIDNITENTILINSQGPDARLRYVMERLVTHLHDFARETRLSTNEWMAAIEFLTAVGQICTDVRQVTYMLSLYSKAIIEANLALGVHPPLRYPRSIPSCRLDQPPEAC